MLNRLFCVLLLPLLCAFLVSSQQTNVPKKLRYPPARRDLNVSDFFYAARVKNVIYSCTCLYNKNTQVMKFFWFAIKNISDRRSIQMARES